MNFPPVNWEKNSRLIEEIHAYSKVNRELLSRLTEDMAQLTDHFPMYKFVYHQLFQLNGFPVNSSPD